MDVSEVARDLTKGTLSDTTDCIQQLPRYIVCWKSCYVPLALVLTWVDYVWNYLV